MVSSIPFRSMNVIAYIEPSLEHQLISITCLGYISVQYIVSWEAVLAHFDVFHNIGILHNQAFCSVPADSVPM